MRLGLITVDQARMLGSPTKAGRDGFPEAEKVRVLLAEHALREYHQNHIDENRLAEYLDTKPRNLPGIENYFSRGGQLMYMFDNSPLSMLFRNYYADDFRLFGKTLMGW